MERLEGRIMEMAFRIHCHNAERFGVVCLIAYM